MNYELRRVSHNSLTGGKDRFTLELHYGCYEAIVTVVQNGDSLDARCEEVPADSSVDEYVVESFAKEFVDEHGHLFGNVGTVLE